MPKRTPAEKAAAAARWHRLQIQAAYERGRIDEPLDAAFNWLEAMLTLAARVDARSAASAYDRAARTVAELAAEVGSQVAAGGTR